MIPSSVITLTIRNGETVCAPPRPDLIASSGLIGTRMGIVSTAVIFTAAPLPRQHRHRVLKPEPQEETVQPQDHADKQQPPQPPILPSGIAGLLLRRQGGV